jgi:hypothetical protein
VQIHERARPLDLHELRARLENHQGHSGHGSRAQSVCAVRRRVSVRT